MKERKKFCLNRVFLLMQKTLYENIKYVIIGLSTIFTVFSVIIFFSQVNEERSWEYMEVFYLTGYFISGIFISGMAFTNLRTKEKAMSYLSLPASTFEKYLSEWILTTFGFTILYTLIFYLFNFILLLFGTSYSSPNILDLTDYRIIDGFQHYFILQSLFLAGAATFKKVPIFYTGFTLFIVGMILSIFGLSLSFVLKEIFEAYYVNDFEKTMDIHFYNNSFTDLAIAKIPTYFYWYLMTPVFWLVGFFKLKEKEA
jgi:hypothetical protein